MKYELGLNSFVSCMFCAIIIVWLNNYELC